MCYIIITFIQHTTHTHKTKRYIFHKTAIFLILSFHIVVLFLNFCLHIATSLHLSILYIPPKPIKSTRRKTLLWNIVTFQRLKSSFIFFLKHYKKKYSLTSLIIVTTLFFSYFFTYVIDIVLETIDSFIYFLFAFYKTVFGVGSFRVHTSTTLMYILMYLVEACFFVSLVCLHM